MLTRIGTWSLGALLACSLVASAEAAPPKTKAPAETSLAEKPAVGTRPLGKPTARPQRREHPVRSVPTTTIMTQPSVENGLIERFDEGTIFYSVALTLEQREKMAERAGVPLAKIPERVPKKARVDHRTITTRMVKSRIGAEVAIELRQDPYGFVYATNLGIPIRK